MKLSKFFNSKTFYRIISLIFALMLFLYVNSMNDAAGSGADSDKPKRVLRDGVSQHGEGAGYGPKFTGNGRPEYAQPAGDCRLYAPWTG